MTTNMIPYGIYNFNDKEHKKIIGIQKKDFFKNLDYNTLPYLLFNQNRVALDKQNNFKDSDLNDPSKDINKEGHFQDEQLLIIPISSNI